VRVTSDQPLHRAARLRLKPRKKPYWRSLEPGQRLGYYKGAKVSTWIAGLFLGDGRYAESKLGATDDEPGNPKALDLSAAIAAARAWCTERRRAIELEDTPPAPQHGPYTIRHAVDDYREDYKGRGGTGLRTIDSACRTHIIPALGTIGLADLTTKRLRQWHHRLAAAPARLRTGKLAKKVNHRPAPTDPDEIRARQSTANNILSILKAALNHAFRDGKIPTDAAWRRVRPFPAVDLPRIRYLTPDEAQRLVNATSGDFRQLVRAALLTGCRYGELTRLVASDVNVDSGTLLIRRSKSRMARHVVLTAEAKMFFEGAAAGKASDALLLTREGAQWKASDQARPMRAACTAAKISPPVSIHILRHTTGSLLAMNAAPMPVISHQLGHADSRITEKHYAHLAPSFVADTIRSSMPTLGIVEGSNVAPMKRRRPKS